MPATDELREPSTSERRLLQLVANKWSGHSTAWTETALVRSMDDGGMGSLRITLPGSPAGGQTFGECVAEYRFQDADGVEVLATLNVDQQGIPFELDVWKVDFTPVRRLPDQSHE